MKRNSIAFRIPMALMTAGVFFSCSQGLQEDIIGIYPAIRFTVEQTPFPLPTKAETVLGTMTSQDGDNIPFAITDDEWPLEQVEVPDTKVTPTNNTYFNTSHNSFCFLIYEEPASGSDASSKSVFRDVLEAKYSVSLLGWEPESEVVWPCSGNYLQFFAWAPYSDITVTAEDGVDPKIGPFTPSTAYNSQVDLLVASRECYDDPDIVGITVPMAFQHALTGIRFKCGYGVTVSSVTISGIYDQGTYNMGTGLWEALSKQDQEYTLKSPSYSDIGSGVTHYNLLADATILMLLPQTLPSTATVSATLSNGKQVSANIGGSVWEAGHLITYNIGDNIIYTATGFENIKTDDGSTNMSDQTFNKTFAIKKSINGVVAGNAPWQAYYAGTTEPVLGTTSVWDVSSTFPDWFSLSTTSGDGNNNPVTVTIKGGTPSRGAWYNYCTNTYNQLAISERSVLVASAAVDRDLSTWDFVSKSTGSCETANCYIIQNYGTYLLPCIYGNAYNNTGSYSNNTTGTNPLNGFINAKGNAIDNPVIPTDISSHGTLKAKVVWQDTLPGEEIISDSDLEYIDTPGTAASCPYIRLNFSEENIKPGNIMIALYDEGNSEILWSWHLWVSGHEFKTIAVKQNTGSSFLTNNTQPHLDVNLGWSPAIVYPSSSIPTTGTHWVAIMDTESGLCRARFSVNRGSYSLDDGTPITATSKYRPSNTFYQWGRKDPLLPSYGANSNKTVSAGALLGETTITIGNTDLTKMVISSGTAGLKECILYPYKFATSTSIPDYYNLWNATSAGTNDAAVTKTVYDPSPRGFKVPNKNAYTAFYVTNSTRSSLSASTLYFPAGYNFTTNNSSTSSTFTFFMPSTGYRTSTGSISASGTDPNGRYWTACRSTTDKKAMLLRFSIKETTSGSYSVATNATYEIYGGQTIRPVKN